MYCSHSIRRVLKCVRESSHSRISARFCALSFRVFIFSAKVDIFSELNAAGSSSSEVNTLSRKRNVRQFGNDSSKTKQPRSWVMPCIRYEQHCHRYAILRFTYSLVFFFAFYLKLMANDSKPTLHHCRSVQITQYIHKTI